MKWLFREAAAGAIPAHVDTRVPARARTRAESSGAGFRTVVLLTLLWFVVTAAMRPLMLPDEGRYAGVAWEMLRSGDWLTPTLDGLPFFHKPPLFYWITASAMSVLGPTDLAARVAPLLGAWIAALAVYLFVRRWWNEGTARRVLFGLLLQPLFALGGEFANLDMLVAGCITATILLLAHAARSFEFRQPYRAALTGAYAMAALGLLAKGLIGFVIPALVIGAWLVLTKRWRTLSTLLWWPGVLLFLAVAAPWFVAMQVRYPDFADYFFLVQHVRRFATGGFNNVQPFWFYPVLLVVLSAPWWPWLARQLPRARFAEPLRGDLRLLMVVWAALVTLFFSLPESKLIGYILPALPPLVVLAADGFADRRHRSVHWEWRLAAALGLLLSSVTVVVLTLFPVASSREIAAALRARHMEAEPVFMLEAFHFDVPFYAKLTAPVRIVDAWNDPAIARHDNWRKELVDGSRFAPARAAPVLVPRAAVTTALCEAPVAWVIGESAAPARYPFLAGAQEIVAVRGTTLWRVDTDALGCRASVFPSAASDPGLTMR